MDPTKQAIQDVVTIETYVVANPVLDEEDRDNVKESADGGQLPINGYSANSPAARPSVVQPHVECGNDGSKSDWKK